MSQTPQPPGLQLPPAGGVSGAPGAHQRRMLARTLDLGIFLALAFVVPPIGAGLGLLYLLVADALWPGQSIGKRLFRVSVARLPSGRVGHLGHSILRNLPVAVAMLLLVLPVVSYVLFPLMGIPLLMWEGRLSRLGAHGQRLGDFLSDTFVVDASQPLLPAATPQGHTTPQAGA